MRQFTLKSNLLFYVKIITDPTTATKIRENRDVEKKTQICLQTLHHNLETHTNNIV